MPNKAPVVTAGQNQTIELPTNTVNLNGTVTDDGLPLGAAVTSTWSVVSGPDTATFGNPNQPITTAQFGTTAGTYVLRLTASDTKLTGSADVTITVLLVNQAPVVNAGANQTIILPNNIANLNGTVTDDGFPQGGTLTTSWSTVSGPGEVVFANPSQRTTTATFSTAGVYVLRLTANDSQLSASSDVTITVVRANQPPTVSAGANQIITQPANTVTLNGSATDDGLPTGSHVTVTWSTVSGPGPVIFASPNQAVTTATVGAVGAYVLRLTASDSLLTSSSDVTITVQAANQAPIVSAGASQTVSLPNPAQLNGIVTDDGLPVASHLTFAWSMVSGPGSVVFTAPTQPATAASFGAAGQYVLRLTANDSQLSTSSDVTITVTPANQPPTVNAGQSQTIVLPNNTVSLNGSATDDGLPIGGSLTYTWSTVSGPTPVFFLNPHSATTQAAINTAGTYVLRLTASDGALTGSADVTVIVKASNRPPVITSQPITSVTLQPSNTSTLLNLSNWSPIAYDFQPAGAANWIFLNVGKTDVLQLNNSDPSFLLSDFTLGTDHIEGTLRVNTVNDDDFVGFVFGFQDRGHFYLFDWKKADQFGGSSFGEQGMTLKVVNIDPNLIPDLWATYVGNDTVRTLYHVRVPWVEFEEYNYTLDYAPGQFTITVKNAGTGAVLASFTIDDNTYTGGKFGFYNYSQESVIYRSTRRSTLAQGLYQYNVIATDPDLDLLSFSLPTAPAGMTVDQSTGVITWPVTVADIGPHPVSVKTQDPAGLSATQSFMVTVDGSTIPLNVSAGQNQTVALPSAAALSGSAIDSSFPYGGPVSFLWSVVSGPGTVTFANASQAVTTANFSATGVYVLRLSANNSLLSGTADVTITVTPRQNAAPIVSAGPNQTLASPNKTTTLNGTATDDGLPANSSLSIQWQAVTAPGTVAFTSPNTAITDVTFGATGIYVLRLSASDGQLTATSDVTIKVIGDCSSPPSGLVGWWSGNGHAKDYSPFGNNGTVIGGFAYKPGFDGLAFSFNGIDSVVATNLDVSPAAMPSTTWDGWIFPTKSNFQTRQTIFSNDDGGFDRGVIIEANSSNFGVFTGTGVWIPTAITLNQWQHIIVVYTPTNIEFYKDGVRFSLGSAPVGQNSVNRFQIGHNPGFNEYYQGLIDEVHVFNRALSLAEIQSIYVSDSSGFCLTGINTPPVVTAGPDQTISQPANIAQLAGTATDDGLPTGSVLAINWTTVSGPGPVAFSNPNSAATSATFNVLGTYVLRLSASDGVFTSTSDVTVVFTPPCQPPPNGLIGWWSGENDATDSTGGNNGQLVGGAAFGTGEVGRAFNFSGVNTGVQIPDSPSLHPAQVTLDAWVNFGAMDTPGASATGLQYIVFKRNHRNGNFEAFTLYKFRDNGQEHLYFTVTSASGQPGIAASTTLVQTDQWYHVAGTYDGANVKLYINGVLESQVVHTAPIDNDTRPLFFGTSGESNFDGKMNGLLDEVHLFNRALSGSEIQGIYQSNTAGICTTQTNRSPVVNAGPDLTIALPNNIAALNGTATDDGLPVGNTLAISWSKVSGPGNVSFLNPNAAATTATFDTAGTYVLRLTATDGALTSTDDVTVTLLPPNQPPSVSAVSPQTIGYTPNLLVNPSNEASLVNGLIPNWNVVSGTWTQAVVGQNGLPAAFDGSTYFFAGQSPTAELSQDIDISAYAGTIALGLQRFEFIGYGRTLNENPADTVRVILEYRDATNVNVLSTLDTGQITPIHDWAVLHTVSFAPAGSAKIRVRLIATRNNGTRNDAVFDGLSLRPVNSAATNLSGTATDDGLPTGSTLGISWAKISGPGAVTFFNPNSAATVATFGAPGSYVLRLSATDSLLANSSDVTITVTSDNQPPVVNAGADQAITFPNPASLNGSVSDDGLPTGNTVTASWSQVSGPGTVTFADSHDPLTTASFSGIGVYVLRLSASDGESSGSADTVITVNAANLAPSVDAGANQTITLPVNQVTLSGSATDDGLPTGSGLTFAWSQLNGPSLVAFADQHAPVTTATFTAPGTYQLRLSASDGELIGSADVTITVNHANQAPVVNAGSAQTITMPNSAQLLGVVTDDGLPTGAQLSYTWSQVSGPGFAAFTAPTQLATAVTFAVPGVYVLRLSASDTLLTGSGTVTITVNPEAGAQPTVSINSPADATDITKRTDVIGTVSFGQPGGTWMLEYSLNTADGAPGQVWKTFATGNGSVDNATLGTFDPTVLLNGTYSIRLTAVDTSNRFSSTTSTVIVSRNQKVGNFTVSFNDLSLPLPGLPIQVVRTYDSRDKRQGDFGAGWTLSLTNIRISKTGILGEHWEEDSTGGLLPTYTLQSTKPRVVTIVFPDGKVYKFQVAPSPASQRLGPITGGTIGFTQLPGATGTAGATLEVVGGKDFLVAGSVPGIVELIDIATQGEFNPTRFKLTIAEGYSYVIDQTLGVQSVTDPNGNTLTFNANGITHSNGESVAFTRDALGRITRISDLAGHPMIYNYDGNGDLVSVTDRENNTTTFTYDNNHYLRTIVDPRGVQPLRNEYDADGRLINQTDAFGKTIGYQHDLATNREVITDRLGNMTQHFYDNDGNVVKTIDAKGGITTYTYDNDDNNLTITNALNETTTFTYDGSGNRLTGTDPLGNTATFTYNSRRQLLTITNLGGNVVTNAYDSAGNVLSTKDPLGNITSHSYNGLTGQLLTTADALSGVTSYQYDVQGNLSKETDPLGNITVYTYDANHNCVSEAVTRVTAGGVIETITTSFQYDNQNRLTKTTYADNSTTQIVYDGIGKKSKTIDQLGRQTSLIYDDMGHLIRTTYPDNTVESSTFDTEGHQLTSTDRAGRVTSFTYDEIGRLIKTTYPDNTFTATTYDAIGEITGNTDPSGNSTHYTFDAAGNTISKIDALNNVTTFTYDGNGNRLSMTDANNHTTSFEYDANNRHTKIIYNDGTKHVTAYDALGRTISKTDQAGKVTQYSYDKKGRLISVTDALGHVTGYNYDELGNQLTQTDPNNHTTRYEYDRLGRRTKRILPLGMFEIYSYDPAGRLQSRADFNGKITGYLYDPMDRLISKTPDASLNQPVISFTYTATGQRATMTDASGTTIYSYDRRDRLTSKATPKGTLTYTYDGAGNVLTLNSSNVNGVSTTYSYDPLNRLTTATDNANGSRPGTGTTTYSYDAVGNLAGYLYTNGVQTTFTYNSLNRLTNMSVVGAQSGALASYAYSLGPAGNRMSATEQSGRAVNFTYDDLYRLTNETVANDPNISNNGSIGYVYDPVGNRLNRTSTVAAVPNQTFTFDANDSLTTDNYDNNGSTTASSGNSYSYDFEDHLTRVNNGAVSYVYDGDGNRVAKTVNGVTTNYLVDTNNLTGYAQVAEEIASSSIQRVYGYGINRLNQAQLINGTWTISFYGYDGHGSVRFLTDPGGAVTDKYDYDSFGNHIKIMGITPNIYRFAGEEYDAESGLIYLRARYLNPDKGRFWTADSYEGNRQEPPSLHKYLYSCADPVNRSDPSGNVTFQETTTTTGIGEKLDAAQTEIVRRLVESATPIPVGSTILRVVLATIVATAAILQKGDSMPRTNQNKEDDDDGLFVYREGDDKPKNVALRREIDWRTGLSFSTEKPAGPSMKFRAALLILSGFIVRPDGGLTVTDIHTGAPIEGNRFFGPNHVSVYLSDLSGWDAWWGAEQLQIGKSPYLPSLETMRLYSLREP